MTDARNANVAEPFRSTLNGFEDAMARTATPRPIKAAHELMLTKLAAMTSVVPRLPVDPDPEQFENVADYLCEAARIFDQWLLAVGREVKANAPCNVDMSCFTDVVLNVVEGFATFEITKCAETIKEDRAA